MTIAVILVPAGNLPDDCFVLARVGDHAEPGDVPALLTERAVWQILYSGAPAPIGIDPESIAAARRIARHFAEHGCA